MPVNGWMPTLWSSWRLLLIAKRQMGVLCPPPGPRRGRRGRRVPLKTIAPTKLAKPGLPSGYVPRERLDELLDREANER